MVSSKDDIENINLSVDKDMLEFVAQDGLETVKILTNASSFRAKVSVSAQIDFDELNKL